MGRLIDEFPTSERRVCGLTEILRMTYRYRSRRDDSALREQLLALARVEASLRPAGKLRTLSK